MAQTKRDTILTFTSTADSEDFIGMAIPRRTEDCSFDGMEEKVDDVLRYINQYSAEIKVLLTCGSVTGNDTEPSWQDGLKIAETAEKVKIPYVALISMTEPTIEELQKAKKMDINIFSRQLDAESRDKLADWVLHSLHN